MSETPAATTDDDADRTPSDERSPIADPADGGSPTVDAGPVRAAEPVDLERLAADLDGVEAALHRLDAGTYWDDELTGEPIPDDVLAADPITRRAR